MKYNRRRWNNILIFSIIAFILLLNLPTIIKSYLIDDEQPNQSYLLNPNKTLQSIQYISWTLEKNQDQWLLSPKASISEGELLARWKGLLGTDVDEQTFTTLQPKLGSPESIEVWYVDQEEPQRITFYKTSQFLLLKNWQNRWIAITVNPSYLLL
ncbi:hypothetical protein M9194_02745 [Vibrio sp. S4M6]|uniref:hypothetical protein n=1 Tax=Vibrio sinus TaxID=2946865 RepID=UPI00202A337D|nr:hypothetical protein [Vibrio sinus]MCL9780349.1 hypothetical protein [Vibrio sinus]